MQTGFAALSIAALWGFCGCSSDAPHTPSGAGPSASSSPASDASSAPAAASDADSSAASITPAPAAVSSADAAPSVDSAGAATLPPTASDAGDSGPGCTGVPIVPDGTGMVATGSNSVGIHGSWFVYSDCADLQGKNCATVTTPAMSGFPNTGGAMCTSGSTSTATGAWGAGIGLELNDLPPQQPFDTVAAGIKGFCFQLTGPTLPATTVRVAFPTQDNNDNAYFEAETTAGQHTVLFTDIAQGSWVTTPQPFEPTKVTLIQFQIPSSTTVSVPWNFCVEGLTAVMQ